MLVLSRKNNESIFIGPDVKVTVVRIVPDKVRIGITAPSWVNVWREELGPIIPENQSEAGKGTPVAPAGIASSAADKLERVWKALSAESREEILGRLERMASSM